MSLRSRYYANAKFSFSFHLSQLLEMQSICDEDSCMYGVMPQESHKGAQVPPHISFMDIGLILYIVRQSAKVQKLVDENPALSQTHPIVQLVFVLDLINQVLSKCRLQLKRG